VYVLQIGQYPEQLQKPAYDNDHYHDIQDGFDFMIHWNVTVDQPQQNAGNNQYD
jgi:hypothetical protein